MKRSRLLLVLLATAAVGGCGEPAPDAPAAELYDYYCGRCHGDDGYGTPEQLDQNPKNDLSLSEMIEAKDRDQIRERIENGYGPMPALAGKVEPQVVDKLTEYTLELLAAH